MYKLSKNEVKLNKNQFFHSVYFYQKHMEHFMNIKIFIKSWIHRKGWGGGGGEGVISL